MVENSNFFLQFDKNRKSHYDLFERIVWKIFEKLYYENPDVYYYIFWKYPNESTYYSYTPPIFNKKYNDDLHISKVKPHSKNVEVDKKKSRKDCILNLLLKLFRCGIPEYLFDDYKIWKLVNNSDYSSNRFNRETNSGRLNWGCKLVLFWISQLDIVYNIGRICLNLWTVNTKLPIYT